MSTLVQAKHQISDMEYAKRFLILGTESNTYYANNQELTADNGKNLVKILKTGGQTAFDLIDLIEDISVKGRAPKVNTQLFALSLAVSVGINKDPNKNGNSQDTLESVRKYAMSKMMTIIRTPSHMQQFVQYTSAQRGFGRGLRSAIAKWYNTTPESRLAYQMQKYQSRYGWSNGDILNQVHPWSGNDLLTGGTDRAEIYKWATGKVQVTPSFPAPIIAAVAEANSGTVADADRSSFIQKHNLSHEMLPTEWKNDPSVWATLTQNMPLGALLKNLGNLGKHGLLDVGTGEASFVINRLNDQAQIDKLRIHPMDMLLAYAIYDSGHGLRGKGTWHANPHVTAALNAGFYKAFGNITPSNTNVLVALDVSGSMSSGQVAGTPLTPMQAAAAMCLIHVMTEPSCEVVTFSSGEYYPLKRFGTETFKGLTKLEVGKDWTIEKIVKTVNNANFGSTDCTLPAAYAKANPDKKIQTIIVYTDSETNSYHSKTNSPAKMLESYRKSSGIDAKMAVVGMTATNASIADPNDPGMLDVVGFDSATPNIINDFAR